MTLREETLATVLRALVRVLENTNRCTKCVGPKDQEACHRIVIEGLMRRARDVLGDAKKAN